MIHLDHITRLYRIVIVDCMQASPRPSKSTKSFCVFAEVILASLVLIDDDSMTSKQYLFGEDIAV